MLQQVSEEIRLCYQRAEECAERASVEPDPVIRQDYLNLEGRWLLLARSYEFTDRLGLFTGQSKPPSRTSPFAPSSILGSSGDGIFAKDRRSRMMFANPACLSSLGRTWQELKWRAETEWHSDRMQAREVISNDLAVIESGQSQTYEEPFDTRSGQRVFLCTKAPLRDEDGNVIGIVGVAKDITVRKSGEHEAENARKELAHRSKNSLAIVHALARKTLNRGDRVEQFEARLLAYARSQDLLTRSPTNRSRLRDLVDDSRLAFAVTDRFKCEGPDVVLDPRVATQVSIALHELATNSIKYGALASDGTIEVCWEIAPIDDARTELTLRWEERSPGTLGQPSHRGFGHDVLTTIVPAELSGTASLKFDHHGLCWTLQTQIDRLD